MRRVERRLPLRFDVEPDFVRDFRVAVFTPFFVLLDFAAVFVEDLDFVDAFDFRGELDFEDVFDALDDLALVDVLDFAEDDDFAV